MKQDLRTLALCYSVTDKEINKAERKKRKERDIGKTNKKCFKYRKKPVVIEAMEFLPSKKSVREVKEWIGSSFIDWYGPGRTLNQAHGQQVGCEPKYVLKIGTLEGPHIANAGDFIIKGVKGEFYACKPDIFKMTYEKVE